MRRPIPILLVLAIAASCTAAPAAAPAAVATATPDAVAEDPGATEGPLEPAPPAPTGAGEAAGPPPTPSEWVRWEIAQQGFAISAPAGWAPMPPASYAAARLVVFGASPEPERPSFGSYGLSVVVLKLAPVPAEWTSDDLAARIRSTVLEGAQVEQGSGEHPAGPMALLRYVVDPGTRELAEQVDAVIAADGVGWVIGLRSPRDHLGEHAPTLRAILASFRVDRPH